MKTRVHTLVSRVCEPSIHARDPASDLRARSAERDGAVGCDGRDAREHGVAASRVRAVPAAGDAAGVGNGREACGGASWASLKAGTVRKQ